VVTVTTTNASTAVTAPAGTFSTTRDVGRAITAAGIPAGATLSAVASATAATLSVAATATGARSATIGAVHRLVVDAQADGFIGWSPESEAEAGAYTVAANNAGTVAPDRITNPNTRVEQRSRG
jgi:hypothetical protein